MLTVLTGAQAYSRLLLTPTSAPSRCAALGTGARSVHDLGLTSAHAVRTFAVGGVCCKESTGMFFVIFSWAILSHRLQSTGQKALAQNVQPLKYRGTTPFTVFMLSSTTKTKLVISHS